MSDSSREATHEYSDFYALFEEAPDSIIIHDAEGDIVDVNRTAVETLGYLREELTAMSVADIEVGVDIETLRSKWTDSSIEKPLVVEGRHRCADGTTHPVEVWVNDIEASDEDYFIASARDISERKAHEQELERYRELVENVPIGIYRNTAGKEGEFVEVNPGLVEMFDADSEEHLLEYNVRDLYANPTERDAFSRRLESAGIVEEVELELKRLSGEKFWGAVTALAWESDEQTYFDGAIQDITEQKAYEQQLEEQRDNLEILNQVVRHDIRNDLQVIIAQAEILESHVDNAGQEYLATIQQSVNNAIGLTRTAKELAEVMLQTGATNEWVPLDVTLERQVNEIRSSHPEAIVTVEDTIPSRRVVSNAMLDSVFRNLFQNAIQHNDKELPEVTVSCQEKDERIRVCIADNGPGIPDHQKETVFGKGEKGLGSAGTGIGLYLVQTLVDNYGGDVWVEDNDPTGSVFVVELRVAKQRDEQREDAEQEG